jgi:hypothetical protein
MSQLREKSSAWQSTGVRYYLAVGVACLGGIALMLLREGYGLYSLAPAIGGLMAVASRFGPAALILILSTCLSLAPRQTQVATSQAISIPELVLCGCVLGYTVAHYRLQGLLFRIFPATMEPKNRPAVRPARLVTREEVGALIIALPLWALVAMLAWRHRPETWGNPGVVRDWAWSAILLFWLAVIPAWVFSTAFKTWLWRQISVDEAELFLQDTLWREMRGDQQRISRWLAWAGRRRPRAEE